MKRIIALFSIVLFAFVTFVASPTTVSAAPPENFQVEQIVGAGLDGPSGFEIAPDGRIFVLERTGKIKVIKNGELLATPFADLPSVASGDRGLIGIAFDPAFGVDNHYVYFYYTGLDLLNRLVRYDASGDVGTNGPFVIYQTNSPSQELHVGGSIRFGPDGKMYFAVGDNGYPPNAQNLSNPHGKILRINKDGSIPVDNPFFGQPGALPEIWAYGMRNPWRFQFDSATGLLYGGDVGDYTWEEVNHIVKGGNYGWPVAEGLCTGICPYINPIYAYNHDGLSSSVTGGPVYRGTLFPEDYQGDLFFGDYARGFIRGMNLDEMGNNTGVYDFDTNAGSVVDLKIAPDGSMYYITYWPGRLYRVSYNPDNSAPRANATSDITKGLEPLTVTFSSEGSYDPDEEPITYLWDFGDGTTSTEANPVKTYTEKGTYTVELSVSDGTYTAQAIPISIQVGTPPIITVGAPTEGDTYRAGDEISVTSHAIDAAGFDLNDADIKTEVILHHDTHIHPFLGPLTGRAHTFVIPDHGEASANTWYEIIVTATDSSGLSDTQSVNIYPIKSQLTFTTAPAGLKILLDGVPHTGPHAIEGVEGFKREISTQTVQELNGVLYVFDHWSDNLAQRHQITTPIDDTTYTAHFREASLFQAQYFNNTELTGEPVLETEYETINFVWEGGSPDALVNNDQFSARFTKDEYFAGGRYKFVTATDDGVRLYIDDQLIIDQWQGNSASFIAEVDLAPGVHEIKMEYFEGFGMATASLTWDLAQDQPGTVPSTPYTAHYFDSMDLSGDPVLVRQDAAINFDWAYGSPDAALPADEFSTRWTKTAFFPAGVYEFTATADDGVRVYVDDELIIDQWINQPATTYTVEKAIPEGNHSIKVEYFENSGGSIMLFDYLKTADIPPTEGFTAEYFANLTLAGDAALTRIEEIIDFDWGGASPDPVLPVDNFSARFTKDETFEAGTYEFTVTADDGVRLYVDNQLVLNKWIDQAPTTYKVSREMTAGVHEVKLEYYENGGGAVVELSYELTTNPEPVDAYIGEYFNNKNLAAPVVLTQNDPAIDFDWAGGSPDPLINANNFSVRWTKTQTFEEGTYEFSVTADDGVRLILDGEVLIDKWIDQAATTYKVQKEITAGEHTIIVEYFENGGGAVAKMNFAKIAAPDPDPEEPTDYTAKFWNIPGNTEIPEIPATAANVTRTDTEINFDWQDQSPVAGINPGFFVAQWKKAAEFEAGNYKFTTTSDDGIRVYIDGELVLDQWNDHSATTHTIEKEMTAGLHTIRVEYYEKWGDAVAKFKFEKVTETLPPPTEQPEITHVVYDDQLQNAWVNWSWDSVVDFADTLNPFSGEKNIKWNTNNQWAGLYLHSDTGFDTTGHNEMTFVIKAAEENQKIELTMFDDTDTVIGEPVKLADFGGEPIAGGYTIYVIPLSALNSENRIINGFHLKDVTGEMANEIYVDSIGFTGEGGDQLMITETDSDEGDENTGGDVTVITGQSDMNTTEENGDGITGQTIDNDDNSATDSAGTSPEN